MKTLWRWTRLSTRKWEDAWSERLAFLGPGQVVFVSWPGSKALKIEAFGDERTLRRVAAKFGGRVAQTQLWRDDASQPRAPINIRGRLRLFADEGEWRRWVAGGRRPPGLLVPAGMAFGTGEHATTAACLRFLCDHAPPPERPWNLLDAGTGSGILAIAAERLGASEVDAFDFDPSSVRIARANARANGCRNVRVFKADILAWKPARRYDFVTANLFSELLAAAAPRLRAALRPRGRLIFSGVLRSQLDEVVRALEAAGFRITRSVYRGKWSAGVGEKAG